MTSAEEEGRRLFVGGLNGSTTDANFRAHFASFFPVANAEVSMKFPSFHQTLLRTGIGHFKPILCHILPY